MITKNQKSTTTNQTTIQIRTSETKVFPIKTQFFSLKENPDFRQVTLIKLRFIGLDFQSQNFIHRLGEPCQEETFKF
jgi:hypothetical protein